MAAPLLIESPFFERFAPHQSACFGRVSLSSPPLSKKKHAAPGDAADVLSPTLCFSSDSALGLAADVLALRRQYSERRRALDMLPHIHGLGEVRVRDDAAWWACRAEGGGKNVQGGQQRTR